MRFWQDEVTSARNLRVVSAPAGALLAGATFCWRAAWYRWTWIRPVRLRGSFYAFRSPLEWYLPKQPLLTLGLPRGAACPRVFVISHETVRQLHSRKPTGRLLVARQGHGACVTAVPERLIRSRIGG